MASLKIGPGTEHKVEGGRVEVDGNCVKLVGEKKIGKSTTVDYVELAYWPKQGETLTRVGDEEYKIDY